MPLAIFDLDNTLIAGDSDHLWGEYLVEQGLVDKALYKTSNDRFYDEYKRGVLDINEFLAFSLSALSSDSIEVLNERHQGFMATKIDSIMLPKAKALIEKHRAQGDTLLIITATNHFVTAPIAEYLGIPHILATMPEIVDNRYTGNVAGTPCFQEGKVERLNEWLTEKGHNLENSTFYSDSHNDLPLLKQVTHPVVVDADEKLTDYAKDNDWPMISLR